MKPANVLLSRAEDGSEHAYLGDFGLTKRSFSVSGLTVTGQLLGTFAYMAPEQIRGDRVDARADQYSLGCVLYECLTGETPFRSDLDAGILWGHVYQAPPLPSALRPGLSSGLDAVVTRALAKSPADRFESCVAMIEAAASGAAPSPSIAPRRGPARKACRRCDATLPTGARFCPSCAAPVDASPPTQERKVVTTLAASLVRSSAGNEDPERSRALADRFHEVVSAEVVRTGGIVEKLVGGAVMAVFGVPSVHEDDSERALHAALRIRARWREEAGGRAVRIGVGTGEVAVGGSPEDGWLPTGESVNATVGLEQAAGGGEILVAERTVQAVGGAFEFGAAGAVDGRDGSTGLGCRSLNRALSLVRPRGVPGLRRVFVGREAELRQVLEAYGEAVGNGRPRLVTVTGEAGIGKSRLVAEALERLSGAAEAPIRRTGRCLPYGHALTYRPVADILREEFELSETDPPDVVLERLGERRILGLALGLDVAGDLHPMAARERLHEAFVAFLDERARERPVVVVLEDMHWAEPPLVDLVDRVCAEVRGALLLLATTRPERGGEADVVRRGDGRSVRLRLLTARETGRMLDEALGVTVPEVVRAAIVDRTEGNPFFVEEQIGVLIDRGLLRREAGGWAFGELPADLDLPGSVQALIGSRIDLLPANEKAGLQAASVIGRAFWVRPLRELLEGEEPDLDLLLERDFVRFNGLSAMPDDREYSFKHAVIRDVAYAGIPKSRRARLHAAFAEWLEDFGNGNDALAPMLAHHYAEAAAPDLADLAWAGREEDLAGLRAHASSWLRRAAELAIGRYEIDEAMSLLRRAIELEPPREELAGLWMAIGRAHAFKYEGEAFSVALGRALELSPDPGASAEIHAELAFQTATRFAMWVTKPATDLVDGWIDTVLRSAGAGTAERAKALIARAYWHQADPGSRDAAGEAARIAEGLGDVELRSWATGARMSASLAAGELEAARRLAEDRLDLVSGISDPDHRAEAHGSAVYPYLALGRFDDARRVVEWDRVITARLSPHHRVHALTGRIFVEEAARQWATIRDLTPEMEALVAANATPCVSNPLALLDCAVAAAATGEIEESRRLENAADALGMQGYDLGMNPTRVRLALVRGERDRIGGLLEGMPPEELLGAGDAVDVTSRLDGLLALGEWEAIEREAPSLVVPGTYIEPFALRALGVARADPEMVERATERFASLGLQWEIDRTPDLT
ncbi:MAG TPA: AAA family ATPase, partial [Actinomycetota bacterium]